MSSDEPDFEFPQLSPPKRVTRSASSPTETLPGAAEPGRETIVGDYVIERQLVRGGMGVVHLGRHRMLNRMARSRSSLTGRWRAVNSAHGLKRKRGWRLSYSI